MDVPEAMRLSRAMIAHPGGDLSARAAECLAAVRGEAEDARQSERELYATMRRMAEERDSALAELEAARAVVEWARGEGAHEGDCDGYPCRCAEVHSTRGRLIVDYDAAKAGKAAE